MLTHFTQLGATARCRLFNHLPGVIDPRGPAEMVGAALGATLYMPATRAQLARDLGKAAERGVVCTVVCLEDAISDHEVPAAQAHAVHELTQLDQDGGVRPLVFVRIRHPDQVGELTAALGVHAGVVAGFVLPKFTDTRGGAFLDAVAVASERTGNRYLAMPVLESPVLMHRESRVDALLGIARLLDKHRERVACVRIGATDLSAALGIRRPRELTVYDIGPVAHVIDDIVNVLGRADGSGYVISGPVWEYFADHERMFRPFLRATPFVEHRAVRFRDQLVSRDLDGLLREISLDRVNGMLGKTVIHPNHVAPVHALSVVTAEEYRDACAIVGADAGGVLRSDYRNKMNEARPHAIWARQVLRRAEVFGVANDGVTFVDLLVALAGLG